MIAVHKETSIVIKPYLVPVKGRCHVFSIFHQSYFTAVIGVGSKGQIAGHKAESSPKPGTHAAANSIIMTYKLYCLDYPYSSALFHRNIS